MACAELYVDIYANEPWEFRWMTTESVLRYFEDLENTPRFHGFVAKTDGDRTEGFCLGIIYDYFLSSAYEIREMAVARERQGRGVGGALLANAETRVKRFGAGALTLVTLKTAPAFEFYIKNGLNPSDDAVYLSKTFKVVSN
jgi:aminoglycoside 6'-N-acetyltransferase I